MASRGPIKVEHTIGVHKVRITQGEQGNVADITIIGSDEQSVIFTGDDWKRLNSTVEASLDFVYGV